ncbi:hypothetical protein E4U21_001531 [Claviceps maximensis]|nr:hypothetical protein E4U21_001531 [Claviceps maximensis]
MLGSLPDAPSISLYPAIRSWEARNASNSTYDSGLEMKSGILNVALSAAAAAIRLKTQDTTQHDSIH